MTELDLPSFGDLIGPHTFKIAWGKNRQDRNFINAEGPGAHLYEALTKFSRGPKDGACLLQGELVKDGQRLGQRVARNHFMLVDFDTGVPVPQIVAALQKRGLAALVWTTHSHMKTTSPVPEKAIIAFAKKLGQGSGHAADINDQVVLDYLRTEKKYEEAVLYGEGMDRIKPAVKRQMGDNGVEFVVTHEPMPRARAMFVLADIFDFAAGTSQTDQINIWKAKYAAVCEELGLPWDSSCTDPSRLMYTPRVPANAVMCTVGDGSAGHIIIDVPGAPLDLDAVDETPYLNVRRVGGNHVHNSVAEEVPDNPFSQAAANAGLKDAVSGPVFQTKGLMGFLAKYGHDFRAAELCAALGFEERFTHPTGFDSVCPNEEHHSNADTGTSRDFMVKNAVDGEEGWTMLCLHQTCKDMSKGDRAWFLDLICVKHDLTVKDLYEYSDTATREIEEEQARAAVAEKASKLAGDVDKLRSEIDAVTPETDPAVLTALVNALASRPDDMETIALTATLGRKCKQLTEVKAQVKAARKARKDQAKEQKARATLEGDFPDDGVATLAPPVPKKRESANPIHTEWGADDMTDCAVQRVLHLNAQNPKLFYTPEGSSQRLQRIDGVMRAAQMDSGDWAAVAKDYLSFAQCDKMTGQVGSVFAPPPVVNYLTKGEKMAQGLPVLESIMQVPVFAPDGSLVVTPGYNPALRMYLDPPEGITFRPLPDKITQEDIDDALAILTNGLLRDFPFSDAFDGMEDEPIKLEEEDDEGFPLVNWKRGQSSRCHMLCMMLQPFVRYMIDGPTPAFHIDKAAAGTGANYLADAMAGVLVGKRATPTAVSENNDELRKAVTAVMRERVPLIFFDNINHKMTSPHLAQVITTGLWKDRVLGESTTTGEIPVKNVWLFAGNNLKFSHELYRRLVPIRLDAAVPNPAMDRSPKDFKYNLHNFVKEYRVDLLWACHVLCGAWVQAGCPAGKAVLASFDSWSAVMGGIMDVIGIPGFLESRTAYLLAKDDDVDAWEAFAQGLWDKSEGQRFTAGDALEFFMGGMTGDQWEGPIELGTSAPAKMATQIGYILSNDMATRTYRVDATKDGVSEPLLVRLAYTRSKGKKWYRLVPQAKVAVSKLQPERATNLEPKEPGSE